MENQKDVIDVEATEVDTENEQEPKKKGDVKPAPEKKPWWKSEWIPKLLIGGAIGAAGACFGSFVTVEGIFKACGEIAAKNAPALIETVTEVAEPVIETATETVQDVVEELI